MSEPYIVEKTRKTPYINFDQSIGKLEINGYSLPTDAREFYTPLFQLVDDYLKNPQAKTELNFHIEYFNTISSKLILQLLIKFELLNSVGKEVTFNWYYDEDDKDMQDAGRTYQVSIKIPTTIIPVQ